MHIFWRLILAHFLADFTLQTNFIAAWKRKNNWGVAVHSLVFLACAAVFCWNDLAQVWLRPRSAVIYGWMSIVLLAILHYLEDVWRVWTIRRLNSPDSFFFFLWDQFIHCFLIFVFSPLQSVFSLEKGIMLTIIFILATHFTTIFVYYMEKDIFGQADISAGENYYSMVERLCTVILLLLPGWWALSFLGVWLIRFILSRFSRESGFSWLNHAIGSSMAFMFGIVARLLIY